MKMHRKLSKKNSKTQTTQRNTKKMNGSQRKKQHVNQKYRKYHENLKISQIMWGELKKQLLTTIN